MIISLCLNPVLQKTLLFSSELQKNTVNRAIMHRIDASGKGINVSRVLTQLGYPCVHVTQLGGSCEQLFTNLCSNDSIVVDYVKTEGEIRFCYTIIDKTVTELVEEGSEVSLPVELKIRQKIENYCNKIADKPSCLVISGSKAPGFSDALYPLIVHDCLSRQIPVIADYRGRDLLLTLDSLSNVKKYAHLLTIKPNASELCCTFSCNNSEKAIKECIANIHKNYGCSCVITQAEKPVLVYTADGLTKYTVIPVDNKLNTTGCGDAFTAGLASILSIGGSFNDAVQTGLSCGAKNALTIRPGSIF